MPRALSTDAGQAAQGRQLGSCSEVEGMWVAGTASSEDHALRGTRPHGQSWSAEQRSAESDRTDGRQELGLVKKKFIDWSLADSRSD